MPNVISGGQLTDLRQPTYGPGAVSGPLLLDSTVETFTDFRDAIAGQMVNPSSVWASQPSVRKVVDFAARAVASTPLKVYRRVSDTDRQRVTDHPLARVLASPSPGMIPFRFWHSVIVDWLLYDRWCVVKLAPADPTSRALELLRLQADRVTFDSDGFGRVSAVWVDSKVKLAPEDCLLDHGYAPLTATGTSPMRTLAAILQESSEAVAYRRSVWRNSARVPVVLQRPASAGPWSDTARDRFLAGWRSYVKGGGAEGGTPLLQDGMTLAKVDAFSPKDTNDIQGRQLSDAEVAAAFHIAPELVGARQGTYSNVEAFRQMLYRDALGPMFAAWEQVINAMLTADLDDTGLLYVEADVDAKLRGSFHEEASVMSTATGAPWLTRNEARARKNLPEIEGGDELVTPLNVLVGGQASPTDTGTQNLASAPAVLVKAATRPAPQRYQSKAERVLLAYFARQRKSVLPALGAKADGWWNADRWDSELAEELFDLSTGIAAEVGPAAAAGLGYDASDYDTDRTVAFLRKVAEGRAANINATTFAQLKDALSDADATPAAVFDRAESRAAAAATSIVTDTASFATVEAAKQVGAATASKTWETGRNPRPEHASMNGETVGIEDQFSNGLDWPGAYGPADEVAGCNCTVAVTVD